MLDVTHLRLVSEAGSCREICHALLPCLARILGPNSCSAASRDRQKAEGVI